MKIRVFFGPDPYVMEHLPDGGPDTFQVWKGNGNAHGNKNGAPPAPKSVPVRSWFGPVAIREPSSQKRDDAVHGEMFTEALGAFLAKEFPGGVPASHMAADEIPGDLAEMRFRIEYQGAGRKAHLFFVRLLQAAAASFDDLSHEKTGNVMGFGTSVKAAALMALARKKERHRKSPSFNRRSTARGPRPHE